MKLSIISLSCSNVNVGSNNIFDLASFKVFPKPTRETSIPVNSNSVSNIRNQLLVIASIKYLADHFTTQKGQMIASNPAPFPNGASIIWPSSLRLSREARWSSFPARKDYLAYAYGHEVVIPIILRYVPITAKPEIAAKAGHASLCLEGPPTDLSTPMRRGLVRGPCNR
jgi:hypothetical protein